MQSISIGKANAAYPTHRSKHTGNLVRAIKKDIGADLAVELYFINPDALTHLHNKLSRFLRRELNFEIKEKPNLKGKEINLI